MADVNERFRAKLAAREKGTVEVTTYPAVAPHPTAPDLASVEGRFQAKLLRHLNEPSDADKAEAERVAKVKARQRKAEEAEAARRKAEEAGGHGSGGESKADGGKGELKSDGKAPAKS